MNSVAFDKYGNELSRIPDVCLAHITREKGISLLQNKITMSTVS